MSTVNKVGLLEISEFTYVNYNIMKFIFIIIIIFINICFKATAIMLCIHAFSQKYLPRIYLILSTVLDSEDKMVSKADKVHFYSQCNI